jgi:hypothetical protein
MDELMMFTELRPADTLSKADLDELRVELFGSAGVASLVEPEHADEGVVLPLLAVPEPNVRAGRRGSSRIMFVAAAVVGIVGLGGLLVATDRPGGTDSTSSQPSLAASALPAAPAAGAYDVPLVGFSEPGWTVTNGNDQSFPVRRSVVWLSDAGFDGPWIEITFQSPGTVTTVPSGEGTVDINGVAAERTDIENGVILRWTDPAGNALQAFGWHVDVDQLTALARQAGVSDAGITIAALPDGSLLADTAANDALGRHVEYRFTHSDGREVQIAFTPGAARGLYQRQGPTTGFGQEGRVDVMIGDEPATVIDYAAAAPGRVARTGEGLDAESPVGEYRVDIQRGFWTWEFNTTGFESQQQVLDLVADAALVDAATWAASLGDSIVVADERADAARGLLEGVQLPPGFDIDALAIPATDDRTQFIAEVSGAVACGWFNEWFAGQAANDSDRRDKAATALATSHDWVMLNEIADQGAWSELLWRYVDNLGATDGTTQQEVSDGLGCSRFG